MSKKFGSYQKMPYLCYCYPENNLFTLKKLIPIEDLERSPVKVIAFFMPCLHGVLPLPSSPSSASGRIHSQLPEAVSQPTAVAMICRRPPSLRNSQR
jgi:hypothetical protein